MKERIEANTTRYEKYVCKYFHSACCKILRRDIDK